MSDCGFMLRVNGSWLPLPGVQAGVPVTANRSRSSLVTVGGFNHEYASRRAPREWSLDFSHATPEAVRLLALAANGQAGDVMLLDVSAARANMLDPLQAVGPDGYPLVDCDGVPVRSLTWDVPAYRADEIASSANLAIYAPDGKTNGLRFRSADREALIKFSVPPTPVDHTLTSATMRLVRSFGASPALTAHSTTNNWNETGTTWDTAPAAGSAAGSAALVDNMWNIPLSDVGSFVGAEVSYRLRSNSATHTEAVPRYDLSTEQRPRLVLTYLVTVPNRNFAALVRAEQLYTLSAFTSAAAGAVVATITHPSGSLNLVAPSGTGDRRAVATFTPAADGAVAGIVSGALTSRVSGLRLTEGASLGGWLPGQKTPVKVAVSDPEQTLNYLLAGEQGRSDYRVTLREVG